MAYYRNYSIDVSMDRDRFFDSSNTSRLFEDANRTIIDIIKTVRLARMIASYNETLEFEFTVGVVISIIYAFVVFVGVVGNVLVITVVALNRQMRNSTNTLIISLALADLLFLVFCVPFTAADYAMPIWVFSPKWCSVLFYFQFVTAYASVWTLVLMAFDRYLAVVYPVQSITLRTVKNTVITAGVVWAVILVANIPHLETFGLWEYPFFDEQRQVCALISVANQTASELEARLHYLTFCIVGYVLPLIVASVLYFFMLRKLWFRMPIGSKSRASEESIKAKRKVTWMVTGVIVTFAICWLPMNICFSYTGLAYRKGKPPPMSKNVSIMMMASQVLAYTNSCLNPILYAFLSDNFRKGFYRILSCLTTGRRISKRDFEFERTETRCATEAMHLRRQSLAKRYSTNSNRLHEDGELTSLKNGVDSVATGIGDENFVDTI